MKPIPFCLRMGPDNTPIRTLDGLREHFDVSDVVDYARNGLLKRWFDARNLTAQSAALAALRDSEPVPLVIGVAELAGCDPEFTARVKDGALALQAAEETRKLLKEARQTHDEDHTRFGHSFMRRFGELREELRTVTSVTIGRQIVGEIARLFLPVFRLDLDRFIEECTAGPPSVAILSLLMSENGEVSEMIRRNTKIMSILPVSSSVFHFNKDNEVLTVNVGVDVYAIVSSNASTRALVAEGAGSAGVTPESGYEALRTALLKREEFRGIEASLIVGKKRPVSGPYRIRFDVEQLPVQLEISVRPGIFLSNKEVIPLEAVTIEKRGYADYEAVGSKRALILGIGKDAQVRTPGQPGLEQIAVNGKFPILEKFEYRSKRPGCDDAVYYIEVPG